MAEDRAVLHQPVVEEDLLALADVGARVENLALRVDDALRRRRLGLVGAVGQQAEHEEAEQDHEQDGLHPSLRDQQRPPAPVPLNSWREVIRTRPRRRERLASDFLSMGEREETVVEQADVVVVGARLAGCAVAAPLARAGRKVVVLDKMSFPSDQLSTHLLMPAGTSELSKLGALPRILALNPSRVRWVTLVAEGIACTERLRPAPDGIDFGVCVPRDLQDVCLVEAVREQGADVRERCTFTSLHWRAGRVAGVRYTDEHGDRARHLGDARRGGGRPPLERRRSRSAPGTRTGVSRNGRGLVFRYLDDPQAGDPRRGDVSSSGARATPFAFAFPSAPEGRLLILLHGPPRRGQRGAQGPRGLLAAQARRAPRPRRAGSPAWTRAPTRSCARPARRRPSSAPRPGRAGRWPATPGTSRTR